MRTDIGNIKQPSLFLIAKLELNVFLENLLTGMLRFGKVFILVFDLILLTFCLYLAAYFVKGGDWAVSENYLSGIIFFNLFLGVFKLFTRDS